MVQEQLGNTLDYYFQQRQHPFTLKTVLQIGLNLLEQYKYIHLAGYIHNDLKLENILVGDS